MTGFARMEGSVADTTWVWEFRSVNGKGLDVRLRLPAGFDRLENQVRKAFSARLSRGNIQANLVIGRGGKDAVPTVNQAAFKAVLEAIESVESTAKTDASTAAQILSLRGVMELSEPEVSEGELVQLDKAILASLDDALEALVGHRQSEGVALQEVLNGQLDEIGRLTKLAEDDPSRSMAAISARLGEQVEKLLQTGAPLDKDRLHQEAAFLATKADIREELDRLLAHIDAARQLILQDGPVGRKLEFLAQEFNREANTLCSKSNAVAVTEIGLALKVVIDQFREQILNIE